MTCACGKGASLEECCLPYIRGDKVAETAEVLMRTRYTAYTLSNVGYLLETHHPSSVNDVDPKSMAVWAKKSQWHGLEIVSTDRGGPGDDEGVVEFIARYTQDGTGFTHHERSRFEKVSGRWYFKSGSMVVPTVRNENKVGRNDPCPCGSGKKYKKCHGA